MADGAFGKLQGVLKSMWTAEVHRGDEAVHAPKFIPKGWIEDGRLAESRFKILKASGWHLDRLRDGQSYLFPNAELAAYALGWASDEYAALFPERAEEIGRAKEGGGYYDLTDAILYSGVLDHEMTLPSGVNLFYPRLPDAWDANASIARNVETALNSGWVMIGLITERDLFLLPPESITEGAGVTPNDDKIGIGTLLGLKKDGLISLRGKFGKGDKTFSGLTLPPRASRGGEWKIEDMIKEQQARWGGADIKPAVNFSNHKWIEKFPSLREWLDGRLGVVEEFDLMRLKWLVDAWGEISDIGALDNILGGIKGVMGEVAAREKIAESYRRGRTGGEVLLVAPQIFDGNMLERSDAIVARVEGDGALAIVKAWEVVTDGSTRAHAGEQLKGSLAEYRKGGVVLRRHDGRVAQFRNVTVLDSAGEIYVARDDEMNAALAGIREGLVTELGMDLVTEKVRNKFLPSFEELAQILKEKDGAERLIELLGGDREKLKRQVVVGWAQSRRKVYGLCVVSEEEAESLSMGFFHLVFEHAADSRRLVSASGAGSPDLAVAWVSGQIGRELDVVEKSYVAGLLGTRMHSQNEETDLTADAVAKHIKANGVASLLEISAVAGKFPNWKGNVIVAGRFQSDGTVRSLRVVSEEEAESLPRGFFHLEFKHADDSHRLVSAHGAGSADFAAAWVSGQIGRELDVVENSYLAGLLGTRAISKSEETGLTFDAVAKHISENGVASLLGIAAVVGKSQDWNGNIVVMGRVASDMKISGLRVVSEEEAKKYPGFFSVSYSSLRLINGSWFPHLEGVRSVLLRRGLPVRSKGTSM